MTIINECVTLNYLQANIIPYSELFHPDVIRFSISRNYRPLISPQIRSVSACLWFRSFTTACNIIDITVCTYACAPAIVRFNHQRVNLSPSPIPTLREHCNWFSKKQLAQIFADINCQTIGSNNPVTWANRIIVCSINFSGKCQPRAMRI